MTTRRLRAYIYLLLVAGIWGAAGPIIKFTLQAIDPLPFLAYRFTIAAVFSTIFFLVKIQKGKKFNKIRANLPLSLLYGFLAVPFALGILFVGLDKSTILDFTLISVIGPLIVTAGGAFFYHDHITHKERVGISIVLIGVILSTFFPFLYNQSDLKLTGNFLLLLYLFADGGSILLAKYLVQKKIKSANLTNLAFIVGVLIIVPLAILSYGGNNLVNSIVNLPFIYHLGVWYMALVSGSLAYFLYVRAAKSIEVSEAVLFNYLQPLFSVPLAVFWLKESLTITFVISVAIIAFGLVIAEHKKKNLKLKANS